MRYPELGQAYQQQHQPPQHAGFDSSEAAPLTPPFIGQGSQPVVSNGSQIQNDVLRVYVDAVEKAKADCEKYVRLAKLGMSQIEETNVNVDEMERKINER